MMISITLILPPGLWHPQADSDVMCSVLGTQFGILLVAQMIICATTATSGDWLGVTVACQNVRRRNVNVSDDTERSI